MDEEGDWSPKRSEGLTPEDYDRAFAAAVEFGNEEMRGAARRLRGI